MRAFASFVNFVVMMVQRIPRSQQREWGLLRASNHVLPKTEEALPDGAISMDAKGDAWTEQRERERGFVDEAVRLARTLRPLEDDQMIELEIETGIPTQCHDIPTEVGDLGASFTAAVQGSGGDRAADIDVVSEQAAREPDGVGDSMYKRNNITMLPIIEAELGCVDVVSAIVTFYIGLRDTVLNLATRPDRVFDDGEEEEEISWNIMKTLGVWTWCDGSPARAMLQQQREGHYNFPGGFHTLLEVPAPPPLPPCPCCTCSCVCVCVRVWIYMHVHLLSLPRL